LPAVRIRDNEHFDAALRRFKRACEKAGILTELRRREYYEKPTQERKTQESGGCQTPDKKNVTRSQSTSPALLSRCRPPSVASALKDQITADMKSAMRAGDKRRLGVIRMLKAAIQRREVDDRIEMDDAGVLKSVEKLVKQGQDSAEQFIKGGRQELADKELAEVEILKAYLPEPLSDTELDELIDAIIVSSGATSLRDMGQVMNAIREQAQGRADMGVAGGRVKARLG